MNYLAIMGCLVQLSLRRTHGECLDVKVGDATELKG